MKLGKIIAVALALVLSPLAARSEGKIAIGPQGGLTFPNFQVKNSTISGLYGNKSGWLGGVFVEFGLWSITLRPELNYVTKGYTVANVAEVKNHYLEVPVLLKINPLAGMVVSPFLVVGPQWSRQVSESVTPVAGTTTYSNTVTDWDLSGVAGLGVDINFSEHIALQLQGRYSYGFRDVDTSTTEVKTRDFYTIAGLAIQSPF
ncbi:MAG: porin family protein [Bdellovibrionota bacterium]